MSTTQRYDLHSPEFRATTHETYARMREESPIHLQPGLDGETPIWFVTRYEDVVTVLSDNERFVVDVKLALTEDELRAMDEASPLPNDDWINTSLLAMDGEHHRRLRQLVAKAFTPRMVERLRPRSQEIADDLVDRVAAEGRMELVDDFAFPLPITVIAELLGIPAEDRDRFRVWSNSFLLPPMTDELREQFLRHTDEFVAYLDVLFAKRRAEPSDDLVSALVQAEEHGERLRENELYSMAVLLIVAGHETTVSLITNAVLALLGQPDELERLKAHPSLMRTRSRSSCAATARSSGRSHAGSPRTPTSAVSRSRVATSSSPWRAPPTATTCSSRMRTSSISAVPRTSTWASDAGRTSASALRSRGWRRRSRSRRCSADCRTSGSPSPTTTSTGVRSRSFAASRRSRSPGV